jgi:uncharacterized protein YjiS (DUF1127 family)
MATLIHTMPGHASAGPLTLLRGAWHHLTAHYAERRMRAETLWALNQLEPRELRDLGITPYDFRSIARGTYRR